MIRDEINKANIEAIKNRDTASKTILSIIKNKFMLAEIDKRTKNEELQDSDCIQIIQKTIKELNEEAENYKKANNLEEVENIEKQKVVIEKFLPQMMSEEEIKNIIDSLDDKSIPSVMKHFKTNYAGKVEMKLVSDILKTL
ncbi:MAG: GatB/YqeY domain-containing protein [Christensenellales bacterium]